MNILQIATQMITKNFFTKVIVSATLYFSAVLPLITLLIVFIGVDFILDLYCKWKFDEKFSLKKLMITVVEHFVLFTGAVLLSHYYQVEYNFTLVNLSYMVASFIASIQLLGIFSSIQKITGLQIVEKVKGWLNMSTTKNKEEI